MSDLDSKLDQILLNLIHDSKRKSGLGGRSFSDYKEQVKQAFIDEGWVRIVTIASDNYKPGELRGESTPFIGKH